MYPELNSLPSGNNFLLFLRKLTSVKGHFKEIKVVDNHLRKIDIRISLFLR